MLDEDLEMLIVELMVLDADLGARRGDTDVLLDRRLVVMGRLGAACAASGVLVFDVAR